MRISSKPPHPLRRELFSIRTEADRLEARKAAQWKGIASSTVFSFKSLLSPQFPSLLSATKALGTREGGEGAAGSGKGGTTRKERYEEKRSAKEEHDCRRFANDFVCSTSCLLLSSLDSKAVQALA